VIDLLSGFVIELRNAGLPVSLTEHLDAAEAIRHIALTNRTTFKSTLAATMVKNQEHYAAFDLAFEVFFAERDAPQKDTDEIDLGELADGQEANASDLTGNGNLKGSGGGGGSEMSAEELADLLMKALKESDTRALSRVAQGAVRRYAGMEPGRPVGGTYYLYRTLRNLNLEGVSQELLDEMRAAKGVAKESLDDRLLKAEVDHRIERLKKAVEAEIRKRLVEDRGAEALAKSVRKPLPEDIDVMHATKDELVQLRRVLQPLSRKLAVRLARRRRLGKRGALDVRTTVRRSLSTGGVPIDPRFKKPRPSKPEIIVIADISGSVASFARFTLHLVHAISSQFSKVRSFVFIDGIDEVSRFFDGVEDPAEAVHRINTEADVVYLDGHSDYGHALRSFHQRWGGEITKKSTVLILGDARNNYHASEAWVVADLAEKARHVYWLNPEPRDYWGSGDSIIFDYAKYCEGVIECRTLRQLEAFVGDLA
jgi:uncharacterized protein with von Willebrand factor type A (vWA) domain